MDAKRFEGDLLLDETVRRLVATFRPERIYLFGSRARGEGGPDSDLDIMVVVPQADQPGYKPEQAAYRALLGLGVAKDILVWTRAEFDGRLHIKASLPATIAREGRLLYAA